MIVSRSPALRRSVIFVLGREDVPSEWRYLEAEQGHGFMLDVEGMGYVFQHESDEDLELIGRMQVI